MAEEDRVDISEEVNPPAPALSQPPPTHAPPPPTPASILPAYSDALPTHLPPPASSEAPLPPASLTSAATDDQARIAALEGTVNQMATNMAKLLALLRGPNRASSSSTPPPGPRPTVDPTPWAPPTQAPENIEAPAPPTLHTSTVHPFTTQLPPPPAPTAVPLPPATFLSSEHILSAPPPVSIPAPAMAYTVPPPMVFPASSAPAPTHLQAAELPPYPSLQPHAGLSYQAPPPINTTFHEPGTPTHAAQVASPTHFFPEADTEQERRGHPDVGGPLPEIHRPIPILRGNAPTLLELSTKEMVRGQRFEEYAAKWRAQAAKHIPPISEAQQIQLFHSTLRGVYYSHLLAHTSSFSNLIEAGKKLDLGIKLGRMEDPTSKGDESSKKASAAPESHDHTDYRSYLLSSASTAPTPVDLLFSPTNPTADELIATQSLCARLRSSLSTQAPGVESPSTDATGPYSTGSTAGNQIQPVSPGPNFDPSVQDQSKHCEYHQGAPGHTLDNCWRLRDKIQRRIDSNRLTFNAVRPPNVQANPLPDHRPSSGPSINMISICVSERDEEAQESPPPFVINYTPEELTIGFTGHVASSAPFVVDIPAREPYSNSKVPWTYEGSMGSVEQQFSVMGVTRLGRVYESPAAKDKGKAPAIEDGATSESSPFPPKKVTEEEAEAFMKIVKASEYKVVEQMAKSPAHISLLALLLGSEPHREALLRVLTAAQVPKETPPDRIEETIGITFQVLDIPNAFSLLLGRPWIHSAGAVPSSLHQRLKFIVEEKLITVKGEEDYAIYKETAVPYISVGDDENLPFHSFETISVIRDYGESGPSRADRMIGKVLLSNNYIPGTGLGARGQGISRPIEIEEYKHRRGLGFRPSCHEIIEARRGHHLHRLVAYYGRLNRGTSVPPPSHFFPGPSHTIGGTLDSPSSDSDDTPATPSAVCAVTEEILLGALLESKSSMLRFEPIPRATLGRIILGFNALIIEHRVQHPNHHSQGPAPYSVRMDRSAPHPKLYRIDPPGQQIRRIWDALRPIDQAYISDLLGEIHEYAENAHQLESP
ncbi:hypothetical protein CRG98_039066 [Punica granatum]|uniref:G-patch domain-containing protein n=1 Tax=Punica granatum TaxID=22663 RepID=A0A2I0I986_PUNGR|nr:hypothetical protein CRG98_039066 [Punica granatum]